MHQYSLCLIDREVNQSLVQQRADDGYVNANALCEAAGRSFHPYLMDESRGKYIKALSSKTGLSRDDLVQKVESASGKFVFWVHPKLAVNIAQWISVEFEVQVSEWVYDFISGKSTNKAELPTHFKRYQANDDKIPNGYFSMLQETTLGLTVPLHYKGFDIPDNWAPDISVGLCFCKWLRTEKGVDTSQFQTYKHDWQDSRGIQKAYLYPDIYLADCRIWFRTVWLPTNGSAYFKKKDPASLQYFDQIPAIALSAKSQQLPPHNNI